MNNQIKELDDQIAELTAKRDALLKVGKRWRAEEGGEYWAISSNGEVSRSYDDFDRIDNHRHKTGDYFQTKEEAQHALKRMIATQQLKDRIAELNAAHGWVADWSDGNQSKYLPTYSHTSSIMIIYPIQYKDQNSTIEMYGSEKTIYTISEEMPEQIKLWLGVE